MEYVEEQTLRERLAGGVMIAKRPVDRGSAYEVRSRLVHLLQRTSAEPPSLTKTILYDGGHFVPRGQLVKETLAWLDRYPGRVN